MIMDLQLNFLERAAAAAKAAGHIWPAMAACEAADESSWGASELARKAFNLFGQKQQMHPVYKSIAMPTREFIRATWIVQTAEFVVYPDFAACFADRMNLLRRLSTTYPHYALALAADTAEEYVTEVSKSWSTNPTRAEECIAIYRDHFEILEAAVGIQPDVTKGESSAA